MEVKPVQFKWKVERIIQKTAVGLWKSKQRMYREGEAMVVTWKQSIKAILIKIGKVGRCETNWAFGSATDKKVILAIERKAITKIFVSCNWIIWTISIREYFIRLRKIIDTATASSLRRCGCLAYLTKQIQSSLNRNEINFVWMCNNSTIL